MGRERGYVEGREGNWAFKLPPAHTREIHHLDDFCRALTDCIEQHIEDDPMNVELYRYRSGEIKGVHYDQRTSSITVIASNGIDGFTTFEIRVAGGDRE